MMERRPCRRVDVENPGTDARSDAIGVVVPLPVEQDSTYTMVACRDANRAGR